MGRKPQTYVDDYVLACAMLSSKTQREAAEKVGINETRFGRLIKTPEYQKALTQARRDMFAITTSKLVQASTKAVEVLTKQLTDKNPYVQYNAASKILQLTGDNIDREEIIERLNRIEEKQAEAEEQC